jgi:hypothetical protein
MGKELDLAQWVESLPLAPEVKASLKAEIGKEEVVKALKDQVMMRSDYSRAMDEARAQAEALNREKEEALAQAEAIIQANTKWREENEKVVEQALRRAQAAEQQKLRLVQSLRDDYGATDDYLKTLVSDDTPPPPTPSQPGKTDDALKREDIDKLITDGIRLQAVLHNLNREHRQLFGDDIPDLEALINHAAQNKLDVKTAWEQLHKVADKRQELSQADLKRRIDAAVQEEKVKWESEQRLPRIRPENAQGIFKVIEGEQPASSEVAKRQERVAAAVARFRERTSQLSD